jgi:hypothetical protein
MGFNPYRANKRDRLNLLMVVGTLGVIVALLVWAIWG